MPVVSLNQVIIKDVLAPLWKEKPVTAQRALDRLGIILRYAAAMGLEVDLQATAKARLLLGKPRHQVKHIPAMAWPEVPAFYGSLQDLSATHLALRSLILTGMRSAPVRHADLQQIDFTTNVWTVPADYMKGPAGHTDDFRVPLSSEALRVIELAASTISRHGLLFPGGTGVIGDMTLSRHMQRRGLSARPHGFRTSLRVWLAEQTEAPREIAETILAHSVGGRVERAYRRTDLLEQRREFIERWAAFVSRLDLAKAA
jgi:integrase